MVRQNFPDRRITDVAAEVRKQLAASGFASKLKPGASVAIGAGSRGIRNIDVIARATVQYWKELGMQPFIFPAMGSHGAATAQGQADVLAHYGIHEAAVGCPVISQLEVVSLGKTADGIESFMDKKAYEADGVMMLGRVKWHTDFEGGIESGLFKMMAIGLGKFAGAQRYHTWAYNLGMAHMVRSVGRQVLESGKIIGGIAILEDAYHNTAKLDAVPAEAMERREEENLALVKSWMGKIPTDLDILIVDEMGKDISGTGMDTKVVNRGIRGEYNPWPGLPKFKRIFVRGLSANGYGNAVGLGMADVTTDRLLNSAVWEPSYINALTASNPGGVRTPIHFSTDRECLERFTPTVGKLDFSQVTYGWIHNSLELDRLAVSEQLRGAIEAHPLCTIEGSIDFEFDSEGNLISPFVTAGQAATTH